ncbi:NADH-quinone oxidoreductase subunit C [Mucilaginibacter daejeonensis]|uniref:NADH-quinone oxidoreductase subunit C n=1 Tax=Mucilaginibacter daejeonensis TaxID=398049 RepID=UPI001D175F51|nr:NADH-quinone oxidoreductase subunit C [Mucilaginibacter daejeonensis]UEG52911.1 NADH-quinone oxidoreductase subunit C [Mucilaginibacter daejeonensis]
MAALNNDILLENLTGKFGQAIQPQADEYGVLTVHTDRDTIIDLLRYIKTDAALQFIYLTDITAIQYPEKESPIGVIYHVHSLVHNVRIRIKVFLPAGDERIPTATVLWNGANWMERETYDFFGVNFEGHPNLVRILNVDDMTVFPMRKEYPLEDPNRVDKKDFYFGR